MSAPDEPVVMLPTSQGYDLWAQVYDHNDNPLVALEQAHIGSVLGDVGGLRGVDVGCGTGRHAVALAAQGAEVTALDFSRGMLDAARRKPGADKVRWTEHDVTRPLPLETGSFDRVLCSLVVDHIHDLKGLFGELGRIAKPAPAGFVLITSMHPAMMLRGVQARFRDPLTGVRTMPESVPNQICDYVMGAVNAGLTIDHMSEHVFDAQIAAGVPGSEKHVGWPMLLILRLRRGEVQRGPSRLQGVGPGGQ